MGTDTDFIARWRDSAASERSNYQLFLSELCDHLDVPRPDPASADEADNHYVFERGVDFYHADGSQSRGYLDLYRRGCFVLEAKQGEEEVRSHDRCGCLSALRPSADLTGEQA